MDETAVCLYQGGRSGHIFLSRGHTITEKANLSTKRAYLTHIAFICDDADIQKMLPQILICNKNTVNAADFAAAKATLPPNVHLWRLNSAWVNKGLCKDIIRILARSLADVMHTLHVILMFDVCGPHISLQMWNALARWGIPGVLIPASETWLLQVLDVYVFKAYKTNVQRHYGSRRVKGDGTDINFCNVVGSICDAIRDVMCGRGWGAAFDKTGWSSGQTHLSERVRSELGLTVPVVVGSVRPSVEELRLCHPRKRTVHTRAIWKRAPLATTAAASPKAASAHSSASAVAAAPKPIAMRTRSKAAASSSVA